MKLTRLIAIALPLAATVTAMGQNNAYWWTRTDASADIELNTVRHALVNTQNQLVAVGRSPSPTGFRGNITIFNRNRAVLASATFNPPGGGDLEITRVFEYTDAYMVAGTATPTGSTDQQIYMAIVDRQLNQMDEIMFPANNDGGEEIVTDLVGTSGHRWVCGRAASTNGWRAFAYHLTGEVDNPVQLANFALGDDPTPQLTYTVQGAGYVSALIFACTTANGPHVHQYDIANNLVWNRDLSQAGGSGYRMIMDNGTIGLDGDPTVAMTWNDEPTPGNPQSHAQHWSLRGVDGTDYGTSSTANSPGANQIVAMGGVLTPYSHVSLFDVANRSVAQSYSNLSLMYLNTWTSPALSGQSRAIASDSYGETLALRTYGNTIYAAKLNTNLVKRFDLYRTTTLNASELTAGTALCSNTGDIFIYASDQHHMNIICYQQAPIAITEQYIMRRGTFFRPPLPVTSNDRYAAGCTISVVTPPSHGTFTMGADGFFNYTPNALYHGPDSFRYQLNRTGFPASAATVNFTVTN